MTLGGIRFRHSYIHFSFITYLILNYVYYVTIPSGFVDETGKKHDTCSRSIFF